MVAPFEPPFSRRPYSPTVRTAFSLLLAAASAEAQDPAPLELSRLSTPVTIDGEPNDAAWAEIQPWPLTMYIPVFRGTPAQRTEIRVAYDDENVYIAGWMFDTEPDKIRVNSLY
ncbi:MAG: hypothetical protein ACREBC_27830, partial [Pyrinomonadaceae bacterium]